MNEPEADWRIRNQETYLHGATLNFIRYQAPSDTWDHDHCEFCWAKFAEWDGEEILKEGYNTQDKRDWICPRCFEDFKVRFNWTVNNSV